MRRRRHAREENLVTDRAHVRWFSDRRRKGKRAAGFNIIAIRCAELERVFKARYGRTLPDDDAGRDDAMVMACHLAHRSGDAPQRIVAWLSRAAPWMTCAERDELVAAVIAKPLRWRADKLAARLGLTDAERKRLKIRTIGAVDLGTAERATRRAARKVAIERERRRANGAKPRAEYEAGSMSTRQPWRDAGISRRSWYRRRSSMKRPNGPAT
jgi:hypothetical protein